jgi:hypothetical protein
MKTWVVIRDSLLVTLLIMLVVIAKEVEEKIYLPVIQIEGQWFEVGDTLSADESGRYFKASYMMDSTLFIGVVTRDGLKFMYED